MDAKYNKCLKKTIILFCNFFIILKRFYLRGGGGGCYHPMIMTGVLANIKRTILVFNRKDTLTIIDAYKKLFA